MLKLHAVFGFKLGLILLCIQLNSSPRACAQSAFERYGDVMAIGLPVMAIGSTLVTKDSSFKPLLNACMSYFATISATYILKLSVNRTRPNGGNYSFPSGHTSSAFAGASIIHKRYGWKAGVPFYVLAGLVGYSRVYAQKHFWSDVFVGAVIGSSSGYLINQKYKDKFSINYSKSPMGRMLSVQMTF